MQQGNVSMIILMHRHAPIAYLEVKGHQREAKGIKDGEAFATTTSGQCSTGDRGERANFGKRRCWLAIRRGHRSKAGGSVHHPAYVDDSFGITWNGLYFPSRPTRHDDWYAACQFLAAGMSAGIHLHRLPSLIFTRRPILRFPEDVLEHHLYLLVNF